MLQGEFKLDRIQNNSNSAASCKNGKQMRHQLLLHPNLSRLFDYVKRSAQPDLLMFGCVFVFDYVCLHLIMV